MPSKILLTGGSGFVGSAVLDELLARGHSVVAVVNQKPLATQDPRVTQVSGGLFGADLAGALADCAAVIHLVGIIMERPSKGLTFDRVHVDGTRAVVDAARRAGVKRYLHMSALGTRPAAVSNYHRTKYLAEEYVRNSGLEWTIFRPSLIHGPRGEFMQMEAAWARRRKAPFLFMPYFGAGVLGRNGAGLLQPVSVKDVARAFADALDNPRTIGEVYPIGGPEQYTWPDLHRTVARAVVGKPRPVLPVPAWYAKAITRIVPPPLLPFNRDQVLMSQEDNTCDLSKFKSDFTWTPRPFEPDLREYAPHL
jgi:NADH dehydrogenase